MNTYANRAANPPGMNTYKTAEHKSRVMNTYKKEGVGVVNYFITPNPPATHKARTPAKSRNSVLKLPLKLPRTRLTPIGIGHTILALRSRTRDDCGCRSEVEGVTP